MMLLRLLHRGPITYVGVTVGLWLLIILGFFGICAYLGVLP